MDSGKRLAPTGLRSVCGPGVGWWRLRRSALRCGAVGWLSAYCKPGAFVQREGHYDGVLGCLGLRLWVVGVGLAGCPGRFG